MATVSLKGFGTKLDKLGECLDSNEWKIPALNIGLALYKRRIFNEGKATDLTPIGVYRSNHIRRREKRGRQIGYKDLFFEGDLNRAIQVGESGEEPVLGFATDLARLIMQGQEKQTGKTIGKVSEETAIKIAQSAARGIKECLQNL